MSLTWWLQLFFLSFCRKCFDGLHSHDQIIYALFSFRAATGVLLLFFYCFFLDKSLVLLFKFVTTIFVYIKKKRLSFLPASNSFCLHCCRKSFHSPMLSFVIVKCHILWWFDFYLVKTICYLSMQNWAYQIKQKIYIRNSWWFILFLLILTNYFGHFSLSLNRFDLWVSIPA